MSVQHETLKYHSLYLCMTGYIKCCCVVKDEWKKMFVACFISSNKSNILFFRFCVWICTFWWCRQKMSKNFDHEFVLFWVPLIPICAYGMYTSTIFVSRKIFKKYYSIFRQEWFYSISYWCILISCHIYSVFVQHFFQ